MCWCFIKIQWYPEGYMRGGSGHIEKNEIKYVQYYRYMYFLHNIVMPCWVTSRPPTVPPFEVNQHSPFRPSQWLWQEMTSHTENEPTPTDNNPLHLRSKVSRVMGESECVCLKCVWGQSLINCQWWTVWVTHVCVWAILRYVRHVWLSVCMCLNMFFLKVCVCMFVCVCLHPLGQVET